MFNPKNNKFAGSQLNNIAGSGYNKIAGSAFNDMCHHRHCKCIKTTVRLFGKCYNTRKFGSIKLGRKSGLNKPGMGVIMVCGGKDCTGRCQVVRRSSSKIIRNIPKVVEGRAVSFAWLMVVRT
ncbi:hypothetical protein AX774_g7126 [Zancudomyces culisetae]|uniref:Uncharacterized protein n=1 Tax=Zancudomyces culisetae TaxID=1213189 RepID=A0A1R1PES2_ZANCU|nr:hypothetical protein AX774_g7126 [Zancudomyces culisetae]|eukprot:OMH79461.1 hypothetical protein AX774_g7126 [Zancudomyces culisetae]